MDVCESCGRRLDAEDEPFELTVREALLYAEKLLRSSVASERMIGADLKQILVGA